MAQVLKILFSLLFLLAIERAYSQANSLEISSEKERHFTPYMLHRHGGAEGLEAFKKSERYAYLQELWYYSESFYIKQNATTEGVALEASIIDISRFESYRKTDEEAVVIMPGFKDALVLLPLNRLIYKPQ
jgi:hypothetical protein